MKSMPRWDQGRWGMGRGTSLGWWRWEKHWLCSSYFPGWYVTKKSNLVKNKAHLAWQGLSCFVSRRFSRFLWSVMTSNWWFSPSSQCLHSYKASLMAKSLQLCHNFSPPGIASLRRRHMESLLTFMVLQCHKPQFQRTSAVSSLTKLLMILLASSLTMITLLSAKWSQKHLLCLI